MSTVEPFAVTPEPPDIAHNDSAAGLALPVSTLPVSTLPAPTVTAATLATAGSTPMATMESLTSGWPNVAGELVAPLPRRTMLYLATAAITAVWLVVVWAAPLVRVEPAVREIALLGHLIALTVGFGAVLAVDWFGLLWMLRRRPLTAVLQVAQGVHPLIWLGLLGLVATGTLLSPDTSATLTRVKLAAVLIVAINGLFVGRVRQRLTAYGERMPPFRVVAGASMTALVSQTCWWTALVVGFLNAQS